jgi:hypothetical protein
MKAIFDYLCSMIQKTMIRLFKHPDILVLMLLTFAILSVSTVIAQSPPPPPPPNGGPNNGHGLGGNQPAGPGAPIGNGLGIIILLSSMYAGKKVYTFKRQEEQS